LSKNSHEDSIKPRKKSFGKDFTYFAFKLKQEPDDDLINKIEKLMKEAKRKENRLSPIAKLPKVIENSHSETK